MGQRTQGKSLPGAPSQERGASAADVCRAGGQMTRLGVYFYLYWMLEDAAQGDVLQQFLVMCSGLLVP